MSMLVTQIQDERSTPCGSIGGVGRRHVGVVAMADNSAFISYRRGDGYPWARLIWEDLQDRSINAFLDLESMRQAGRFDERILNQIAARPYFLLVLAEGSLDRCASESDWVRREIEHAIETDRTIVPLFIAPFETSQFPSDLPAHISEALANSNGVTFYSQFLAAALDQLAEFLQPVALARAELTDDDAEFEQRALGHVRAEPPPIVPITPGRKTSPAPEPLPSARDAVQPIRTGMASEEGGSNDDWAPPPVDEASQTTTSGEVAAGSTTASVGADTASVQTGPQAAPPDVVSVEPTPTLRRKRVVIASVAAVALAVVGIVALTLLGGDDSDATDPGATAPEDVPTTVTTGVVDTRPTGLQPNEWLESGQSIATEDGDLVLRLHPEGWLELLHQGEGIWEAGRESATPGAGAVMQNDGNFVLYQSRREAETGQASPSLFSSGTHGKEGATLELRGVGDDPHVAIVLDGTELWREPARREDPVTRPVPTESSPSSSLSSTSSSLSSASVDTTLPRPASIELVSLTAEANDARIDLTFVNRGGSEGYVERVEFVVVDVVGRVSRSPARSSSNVFDLSADLDEGVRCSFDPGWDPIPASGEPVVRTVRFGLSPDGQTIGRSLQLEMTVVGENVRLAQTIDVSVNVVGTSSESPAIRPACTQG